MSACIIPAGPEFQDPPGDRNSPPFLLGASPAEGTKVVDPTPTFSVTPSDLNVGDDLWVKWITEFPPATPGSTQYSPDPRKITHSSDGSQLRETVEINLTCGQLNNLISTHQVMIAISDREFVRSDDLADLLKTKDGTFAPLQVVWTWQKTCPGGSQ